MRRIPTALRLLPAGEVARDWFWHRLPEQLTFDEIEAELAA